MKTVLIRWLVLGLIAANLVGCGSGSGDSAPDTGNDTPQDPVDDSPVDDSGEDVVINENWTLVWSDEFDGETINTENWSHETNCAGGGNNELQCYTDREENSFVEDGKLVIVAREETYSGPALFDDDPNFDPDDTSVTKEFTSARLRTKNKADWRYGRIEVKAKMPEGQGMWPAIWMLPTENVYGGWPLSGEIDIFEAVNINASGGNTMFGTLHYGREWPNNVFSGEEFTPADPIWERFHTYAVEWEEGEIRWYVDNNHFATQRADGWFTYSWQGQEQGFQMGEGAAPFDELFHVILNVAVGGNLPGAPNDNTSFPQRMEVDYVRVYECSLDPETGKGCATDPNDDVLVDGNSGAVNEINLYQNGASTLTFDVFGTEVTNTPVQAFFEASPGNLVVEPEMNLGDQTVWEAMFNGPGNIFLLSESMDTTDHVDTGFVFNLEPSSSAINFDMRLLAAEESTDLKVKLDSLWPNVSEATIERPALGEWVNVSVRLSDLEPNSVEPGQVDFSSINSPFVLEPVNGTAELQVNNISISCFGSGCGVDPLLDDTVPDGFSASLDVLVDGELGDGYGVDFFTQDGQEITQTRVDDPDQGSVLEFAFTPDGIGTMFIQSGARDLSEFATGELRFKFKVVDPGENTGGFLVKADCIFPCSSNEIAVPMPDNSDWQTVSVPMSELTGGSGFDFSRVDTPFSFWPIFEEQGGVVFRIDDVQWVVGDNQ